LYNPPKNSIFIDGKEIYSIPLEVLRNNIIIVPQDIFLFSDTLANNIRFGRPEASMSEVEEVAKIAQIYNEIMEFEDKFDTVVGERGVTLSGGQKQRVAIARALLLDPNILILDDSLSAIDTKTEKNLLDRLIELRKDKTTIIVAHRISSLQHANHIIVLDNGKISEEGTHRDLLLKKGIYWDLFQKQRLKEKIEGR
jgi:ATP-binding cassette subfamily B protein